MKSLKSTVKLSLQLNSHASRYAFISFVTIENYEEILLFISTLWLALSL